MEPSPADKWQEAVQHLVAVRRPEQAEQVVRRRLAAYPQDAAAHELLGLVLLHQKNRNTDALEVIRQTLALAPQSSDAHYFHSVVLLRTDQSYAALQSIEEALGLNPVSATYWGYKAVILNTRRQPAEALEAAGRGLVRELGHLECLYQSVLALRELGQPCKARHLLERIVYWHPAAALSHFLLGEESYEHDQFADAANHLREALRLDPTYAKAQQLLVTLLLHCGNLALQRDEPASARTYFLEAWQLAPANPAVRRGIKQAAQVSLRPYRQWQRANKWLDGLQHRPGWQSLWAWPLLITLAVLLAYFFVPLALFRTYLALKWRRHPDVRMLRETLFSVLSGTQLLGLLLAGIGLVGGAAWLGFWLNSRNLSVGSILVPAVLLAGELIKYIFRLRARLVLSPAMS